MTGNLHTHTVFCDGRDTAEAMVQAAVQKGFDFLGFSGHAFLPGQDAWCMSREEVPRYRAEIAQLRERYAGRLRIFCGIEQDSWSPDSPQGYDYVIGSTHALFVAGQYLSVDDTSQAVEQAVERHWGGDYYAWAEDYYALEAQVVERTGADIIGHFDLLTKFNEGGRLFDETHPRYVQAAQAAALTLLKTGRPFELNTGAMARGIRTDAYPSAALRAFITRHGGVFLLTSDCHDKAKLDFAFDRFDVPMLPGFL